MPRTRILILTLALALTSIAYPAAARVFAADVGFADDYETSVNIEPVGSSPHSNAAPGVFNTDLAFWGTLAVQGTFEGFRIIDISNPASPTQITDYTGCATGTTDAGEGDVVIWGNILVRSWHVPAGVGGRSCGDVTVAEGTAGSHVFDITNPANPTPVAFVPTGCGSHSLTAVPDPENARLLVYSGASGSALSELCRGMDIISVPIGNPAGASHVRFEPSAGPGTPAQGRICDDVAVVLGAANLAACAGGNGYTVWSFDPDEGGSLEDPAYLYSRPVPGVSAGHSAAFTWDGRVLVFGHQPGGGSQARCQESSAAIDRTLFFFDAMTGEDLGEFELPRPQTADENCTWNRFNVAPTNKGYLLVAGNYQSGISVVDFTDPKYATEVAFADPAPLEPAQTGGDWASYWYNGHIYQSDMTRGLNVWRLRGNLLSGTAKRLPRSNPQTVETTIQVRSVYDTRPTGSFRLVGHERLLHRGMNAALAIHGDYAYIGSRTDGDEENSNNAGIMVVDISDPTAPTLAGQVGPPWAAQAGESARELRVWQSQDILIVLNTNCSAGLHHCRRTSQNSIRFFDISGDNAADPQLILQVNRNTHEFYLWEDPNNPERALMIAGSAGTSATGTNTALTIWDISPVRNGQAPTVMFGGSHGYSNTAGAPNGGLHSLSVSNDGTEAYYALLTGGFAVMDISDFTAGRPSPQRRPITVNANRPTWPGPGAHSAIKLWGRDWVYASDEVYGTAAASGHGCPWGWGRMIDISDRTRPTVEAQYRVEQNFPWLCHRWEPRPRTSYSAHNPTHTPNIVFTSWHSNGFQAINVEDPTNPYQLAQFDPKPLRMVQTEDPMLSSDTDTGNGEKAVVWSYPIIKDGLIYIVDVRNGLYILEYDGEHSDEVAGTTFLEGNSNLGHALCFDHVLKPKDNPDDPDEYLIPDYC